MHNYHKILTASLAVAILATGLSGCGGKKKKNPVATETEVTTESISDSNFTTWSDNTRAREAIESGNYETAKSLASSRISENPGDAKAHALLGQTYAAEGEFTKALKSFEAAIKLEPENTAYTQERNACMATMADNALKLDLPSEALELLKKLVKTDFQTAKTEEKLAKAYVAVSDKLASTGNIEEAESILREGMNIVPDYPELRAGLAKLLMSADRLMEAERILRAMKETNPEFSDGLLVYASLLHRMGEIKKAETMLDAVLKISPENVEALTLKQNLQKDVPVITVSKMPEHDMSLEASKDKLKTLENSGSLSEQKKLLEAMSINFPGESQTFLSLSIVNEKLGQIDNAILNAEKFLKLQPESAKGKLHYARCLYQKGQHEKALEIIDQLEPTYPDKLEITSERGQVMARTGNFAQARELWKQVLEADSEHTATLFNFGQLETESGNFIEAQGYYEKAIRKEPFNNKFRYFAGINLIQSGLKDQATALWEASRNSLNPEDPYASRILAALGKEAAKSPQAITLSAPPPVVAVSQAATTQMEPDVAETIIVPRHVIEEGAADHDYDSALEYARGGFFNEAIQAFKSVLSRDPGNFNALMNLGKVYVATGKQNFACAYFLKALKIDPQNLFALRALANAYSESGMHQLAAQITAQVKASHPDQTEGFPQYTQTALKNDPRAFEPVAQALISEGLSAEALAVVQTGLSQQNDQAALYLLQGDVLKQTGQFNQAMESYKTAMAKEPQNPAPFIRMGDLYAASGQTSLAIEEYQKALKTSFIEPDSMFIIADRFQQIGREADAKRVLSQLKGMNLNQAQIIQLDQRLGLKADTQKEENL
ncbi:MAG: tetratricopeptide repeat protein [Erysipelotrichia bacterium]|nr:tetratricopeptide repeat protein [Erysipelotrichia bacterium]